MSGHLNLINRQVDSSRNRQQLGKQQQPLGLARRGVHLVFGGLHSDLGLSVLRHTYEETLFCLSFICTWSVHF